MKILPMKFRAVKFPLRVSQKVHQILLFSRKTDIYMNIVLKLKKE